MQGNIAVGWEAAVVASSREKILSHFYGSWWSPTKGEPLGCATVHRAVSSLQTMVVFGC